MSKKKEFDPNLLKRLYCDEQMTLVQMAAKFHVCHTNMRKQLVMAGVRIRSGKEARILTLKRRGKPGHLSREFLLREYVELGRTTTEIARDLEVNPSTILSHLQKAGIARRSASERRKKVWSDEGYRQRRVRENSLWWKGGMKLDHGYLMVYIPDHPNAGKNGYIYQHRLVMEKMIGRRLRPEERVHHKNHVKTDNRPENLELFSCDRKHLEHHVLERRINRVVGFASLRVFEAWLNRSSG